MGSAASSRTGTSFERWITPAGAAGAAAWSSQAEPPPPRSQSRAARRVCRRNADERADCALWIPRRPSSASAAATCCTRQPGVPAIAVRPALGHRGGAPCGLPGFGEFEQSYQLGVSVQWLLCIVRTWAQHQQHSHQQVQHHSVDCAQLACSSCGHSILLLIQPHHEILSW